MLADMPALPTADTLLGLSHAGMRYLSNDDNSTNGIEETQHIMLQSLAAHGIEPMSEWLGGLHNKGVRHLLRNTRILLDQGLIQAFCIPLSDHWADDLQQCVELIAGDQYAVLADLEGLLISSHNIDQAQAELIAGASAEILLAAGKHQPQTDEANPILSLTLQQAQQGSCYYLLPTEGHNFVLARQNDTGQSGMTPDIHQQLMTLLWILKQRYER